MCIVRVYMDEVDHVCCACVHGSGGLCVLCMCTWIRWSMYMYTVCWCMSARIRKLFGRRKSTQIIIAPSMVQCVGGGVGGSQWMRKKH